MLSRFPALPAPIEFTETSDPVIIDAAGGRMRVAHLGTKGPYFLDELAHKKVLSWASGPTSDCRTHEKLLVLAGPTKGGKTALLKALARVLAARVQKEAGRRHPVILDVAFSVGAPPHLAALKLTEAAADLAKRLGFTLNESNDPVVAFAALPRVMGALAKGIHAAGGELILLLDEAQVSESIHTRHVGHHSTTNFAIVHVATLLSCFFSSRFHVSRLQAPIMAAKELDEASRFATTLKDVYTACHDTSRIAITGSGMIALLNYLRNIKPNGYTLWGSMARVHLGATPNPEAATAMAKAIIGFRNTSWGEEARARITPEVVLRKLGLAVGPQAASADPAAVDKEAADDDSVLLSSPFNGTTSQLLTAPRPALVAYLADLVGTADVHSAATIEDAAMKELLTKIREEVQADAAIALADLMPWQRQLIYSIATGTADRRAVAEALDDAQQSRFMDLLDTLCEPSGADGMLQLLPPYGVLFSSILNAEGSLLVEWSGQAWKLDPLLQDRLRFFGEQHFDRVLMPQASLLVSKAALEVLESNHIGHEATGSLAEWAKVPAVRAILDVLKKQAAKHPTKKLSPSVVEFEKHLAGEASSSPVANTAASKYLALMGLNIICWVRHVEAHAYISKSSIVNAGLRISLIDVMMDAAVSAWRKAGGFVSSSGVPDVPPPAAAGK